jgi:hypothetical protein
MITHNIKNYRFTFLYVIKVLLMKSSDDVEFNLKSKNPIVMVFVKGTSFITLPCTNGVSKYVKFKTGLSLYINILSRTDIS